jgi:hypothetical protein
VRTVRVSERFNRAVRRIGVGGATPDGRALYGMIRGMLAEALPAPQDFETLMPPVARYWCRRVPTRNLWLFFAFDEVHFSLVSLTAAPPVPILSDE